jgi:hypothetical protein
MGLYNVRLGQTMAYSSRHIKLGTAMNPRLEQLHPYPFQKLRELFAGVTPNPELAPINLSIGEPKHPTPQFIKDALIAGLSGLSNYPITQGSDALRKSIAWWVERRFGVKLDFATEVLPVNGSREALFAFAQACVDSSRHGRRVVISPNPFYQIYEGAALLAGARKRLQDGLVAGAGRSVGAGQPGVRLFSRQPHRQSDVAGRLDELVCAVGSARLRHRRRRMLFGNLF